MLKRFAALSTFLLIGASGSALAQGDPEVVAKIIEEGKNNSQVWDHLSYLSEEIGTRLTGSSSLELANEWTRDQFASYGLSNCHLMQWGEIPIRFDRGPSYARMISPVGRPLAFTTRSWTPGTDGPVKGLVIKEPKTAEDLAAVKDQLPGAWILSEGRNRRGRGGVLPPGAVPAVAEDVQGALDEAGIAGIIAPSRNDLVITTGSYRNLDPQEIPTGSPEIMITRTDYDDIVARLDSGEKVVLEINADNQFKPGPIPVYNTIAEIPGTEWPEQVVIVSAHLDSWDGPSAMGSQDNGTGSSVTLEAARLLMEAGAKPKRTIRFILWTGEEQGLLGSRAYVQSLTDEEKANISACIVDDGGTNYEGGLVCIEPMADMLREATAPVSEAFPDMPVEVVVRETMPRGGGSDHASFNTVGIPGFFWDERGSGGREGKNYQFVHHTQHDTPRYAVPEYLVQSATCAAVTAYNLACADKLLPREDPEVAAAARQRGGGERFQFEAVETPLSGTWNAIRTGEDVEGGGFTLTFEVSARGGVRGTSNSEAYGENRLFGRFDAESGEFNGNIRTDDGGMVELTAKVEGESMKGSLSFGGQMQMPFEATKAKAEEKKDEGGGGGN